MSEHDFQNEVLQQLGEIQGTQKSMYDEMRTQQSDIKEVRTTATKAIDSAKSAHHRINFIWGALGGVATVVGGIVLKLAFFR